MLWVLLAIFGIVALPVVIICALKIKFKKCEKCKSRIFVKERSKQFACISCNTRLKPKDRKKKRDDDD